MKKGPSIRIDQSRAEKGTRQEINDSFIFFSSEFLHRYKTFEEFLRESGIFGRGESGREDCPRPC